MMPAPPRYSRPEYERRFRVIAERVPPLDPATARLIEDRYIDGSRLRLRRVSGGGAATVHKFCKKYGGGQGEAIVNIYLSAAEYAVLSALPGHNLVKRRFPVAVAATRFGLDLFENPHRGLMLCEVEGESLTQLDAISLPVWVGAEVTDDPAFTGAALAVERAAFRR